MGQDTSVHQPELALQPGTYRIASRLRGTAIQVSDHDHNKIVTWETHDRSNQKASRCVFFTALRVVDTDANSANTDPHSLVYASRFPTTWVLLKVNDGYLIQYAGNNRVLDLHWGWGNNGNEIHIWPAVGENANKIWKFERLSDDAGEELPASFRERADRLTQDLDTQTQNLARKDEKIALLEQELANLRREAEEENSPKLAKLMDDLAQKDVVIRQLRQEVKEKDEALTRAGKENEEMSHLRKQQVQLQNELSQQQAETASLQGKMDRVEYLMARMSKSYDEV